MAQFLYSRIARAKYLLVAEAIGYQGADLPVSPWYRSEYSWATTKA
ncbi:MAG: hypothetical protein RQM92_00370 [Candidatus Syntrophopropionicum ammoniitolerans]